MSEKNLPLNEFLFKQMEEGKLPFLSDRLDGNKVDENSFLSAVVFYKEGLAFIPNLMERLKDIIPSYSNTNYLGGGSEYSEPFHFPAMKIQNVSDYDKDRLLKGLTELANLYNQRVGNYNIFTNSVNEKGGYNQYVEIYSEKGKRACIDLQCFNVPYINEGFLPEKTLYKPNPSKEKEFLDVTIPKLIDLFKKYGVEISEDEAKKSLEFVSIGKIKIPSQAFDSVKFCNSGDEFRKDVNQLLQEKTFELMPKIVQEQWSNVNQEMSEEVRKKFDLQMYGLQCFSSPSEYDIDTENNQNQRDLSFCLADKDKIVFEKLLKALKRLPTILRNGREINSETSLNLIILGGLQEKLNLKDSNLEVPIEYLEKLRAIEPDPNKVKSLIYNALNVGEEVAGNKSARGGR